MVQPCYSKNDDSSVIHRSHVTAILVFFDALNFIEAVYVFHISKTFSTLSGVRALFGISPHLNTLCTSSEKRYYTENTNYFKHDVQLLHTVPSTLTNISDNELQQVNINSARRILCTLNTFVTLFSSRSGTPFLASDLPDPAV